ncbi:MAG: TIGR02452 family protein [Clostridia bacterium]|nr:TIGR02452 family protein [Clostridia bacterium]
MKICVLFGSFNPLTNAHVTALRTAVNATGADKGLFVATNGQYLKRKTVKINDPFYLPEDERKAIIEKVCESEPKLEFWGFELGGINPSRFKTLCKIQKQYPDAEIYEIQGADKVHTLLKSAYGEEYVGNFRFVVFKRYGIDLDAMLGDNSALGKFRDSFVILPSIEAISSTEIRNRFYAGKDFSSLVPNAVVEIMSKYKPSDFSISFAERMKVMMASGRFGRQTARKEIYKLNTALFHDWQNGTANIDLGNYKAFLDGAKLYKEPYDVGAVGKVYDATETGCINADCMDIAEQLIAKGYNPAILNLASAKRPCGGWDAGMGAQEESLCFSSTLSQSLYQYGDPKYKNVRDSGVPLKEVGYPHNMNYGGIYSPNVTFFRNNVDKFYTLKDKPFKCDVITVAALCFNGRSHYAGIDELSYQAEDGGFTPEGKEIMLNKIRTIFRMGVKHGNDALVLGAFGCGAYALLPSAVAPLFRIVMEEPEFKNKFKLLVFAMLERPRRPQGLDGHFAPFYQEFGTYTIE